MPEKTSTRYNILIIIIGLFLIVGFIFWSNEEHDKLRESEINGFLKQQDMYINLIKQNIENRLTELTKKPKEYESLVSSATMALKTFPEFRYYAMLNYNGEILEIRSKISEKENEKNIESKAIEIFKSNEKEIRNSEIKSYIINNKNGSFLFNFYSLEDEKATVFVSDINNLVEFRVPNIKLEENGTPYIIDRNGYVIYDEEKSIISKNIFDLHSDYESLLVADKKMINEEKGVTKYDFIVRKTGEKAEKIVSWNTLHFGDNKLIIAIATPVEEILNDVLRHNKEAEFFTLFFILLIGMSTLAIYRFNYNAVMSKIDELKVKYNSQFDNNPNIMFIVKSENKEFVEVNKTFLDSFDLSKSNVIGKTIDDIELKIEINCEDIFEELNINKNIRNEEVLIWKNRDFRIYGLASIQVLRIRSGELLLFVINDITKKKELEKDITVYKEMVEQSDDSIILASMRHQFKYANRATEKLFGWSRDELIGKTAEIFRVDETDKDRTFEDINEGLLTEDKFSTTVINKRKDGTKFWCYFKTFYIYDADGIPLGIMGIHRDVTEELDQKKEIVKAKEAALTASKTKSEFLANMSHEIRTPLNGVIGFLDLMRHTKLNEVQKKYLENSINSSHALLDIINEILDFSKIEAGKLELEILEYNIINLAEQTIDIIKHKASQNNLELLLNIYTNVPMFAKVDRTRLKQILINLLSNAVKFTEKGEVELKIRYKEITKNRGEFQFSVRDTGIGITKEQSEKLFKAFSQADTSTTRKFGGTGLGLVISNLLAEKMGSKIKFKSKKGEGTTFYFDFETEVRRVEEKKLENIKKVLLVVSNKENKKIMKNYLKALGLEVSCFDDEYAAIKIIENKDYDFVIVDYNLPYIDGLEFTRIIEKDYEKMCKVSKLMLINFDDELTREKTKDYNNLEYIYKPIKPTELFKVLKDYDKGNKKDLDKKTTKNIAEKLQAKKNTKILIAEDNKVNMMLAKSIINQVVDNIVIDEANDGEEAYNLAIEKDYDIMFMDVQMPKLDGIAVTKKIREYEKKNGGDLLVIALTAGAMKDEENKCIDAGMNDFATKPIDTEKIKTILNKYLVEISTNTIEEDEEKQGKLTFNKNALMEKIGNNEDFYKEVLDATFYQIDIYFEQIENGIAGKNIENIINGVHGLKGIALNMIFEKMVRISRKLENYLKTDEEIQMEKIEYMYSNIKEEWERVKKKL